MEHHNKKAVMPGFPAAGFPAQFPGLQNSGANALMSTLQSLQMHSLGNSIMPGNNLNAEFSQRMLLEQVKAMQSVYTFNMKGNEHTNLSNGVNGHASNAKITQASTIFPTTSSYLPEEYTAMAGASFAESLTRAACSTAANSIDASVKAAKLPVQFPEVGSTIASSMNLKLNSSDDNGMASSSIVQSEWLKTFENAYQSKQNTTPVSVVETPAQVATPFANEEAEKDEHKDEVDEMFGLSNLDDEVGPTSHDTGIFGNPNSNDMNGGLSPVNFTPPDSPTDLFSTDALFGLEPVRTNSTPASCSSQPSTSAALNNKEDVTSDGFKVPGGPITVDARPTPTTPTPPPPPPPVKEPMFARKVTKSSKVPVYKQKMLQYTFEKKPDNKEDAFEFDDDDDDGLLKPHESKEKETDIFSQCDAKSKNVYVPGIGFAISNEAPSTTDPLKNILPKNKPISEQAKISASGSVADENEMARINDSAFITLAESIRLRKNQRFADGFLKPSMSNDRDCSKNVLRNRRDPNLPPLPKLCIRIQTYVEQPMDVPPAKRKKKKKGSDDDTDDEELYWTNGSRRKRPIVRTVYSSRLMEADKEEEEYNPDYDEDYKYSKQRTNGLLEGPSTRAHPSKKRAADSVKHRLSKFGSADGVLPKGTYVVCKSDLLRDNCALWRVDNQNLLQKFIPRRDVLNDKLIYKSSSTYSGWCEQISGQYLRVSIKVIKQNRSETTIEPEIPLNELFPATSVEIFKNPRTIYVQDVIQNARAIDENLPKDVQRISLNSYIMALLEHALTLNHLSQIREKNDWSFLRSLTEMENCNAESEKRIRKHVKLEDVYDKMIEEYTRLMVVESEYYDGTRCQICNDKVTKRVLQFYDKHNYDAETFELKAEAEDSDKKAEHDLYEPLPALDVYSCTKCAKACNYLHKIHHLKLHLFRICEDKLESVGTEHNEVAPERIVEIVKKDKPWITSIVNTYCDMWKVIKSEYSI